MCNRCLPVPARIKWEQLQSEALLRIFRGFHRHKNPILTASYMQYILRHGKLPRQCQAYEQFLGIYYENKHFYGINICLKNRNLFTLDGLNHSQIENHSINNTYKAYAKIFNITHIKIVILKRKQSIRTNMCLPLVGAFFIQF